VSSIASFYVLPAERLDDLSAHSAQAYEFLLDAAREVDHDRYPWSGYCLLHVTTYLEDRGVVFDGEYHAETARLNYDWGYTLLIGRQGKRHLEALERGRHRAEALAAHFAEMGLEFPEAGQAGLDGIALLRDQIAALADDEVLVVHIG